MGANWHIKYARHAEAGLAMCDAREQGYKKSSTFAAIAVVVVLSGDRQYGVAAGPGRNDKLD